MNMKKRGGRRGGASDARGGKEERTDVLPLEGSVEECLPGTFFKVKCSTGHTVLCTLAGKMRVNRIRLLPGDLVRIEVSPYDLTRGRVVWRGR